MSGESGFPGEPGQSARNQTGGAGGAGGKGGAGGEGDPTGAGGGGGLGGTGGAGGHGTGRVRRVPASRWRMAAYLLIVIVMALGLWRVEDTTDELHALVRSEAHEEDLEEAQACVNQHERYHQLVQAIEEASGVGALVGTDAHLDLLQSTESERHAAHEFIERRLPRALRPVLDRYPPPECDLEAARAALADQ
jgi:hypothetical protein